MMWTSIIIILWGVACLSTSVHGTSLLMVGNSYLYSNNMNTMVSALLEEEQAMNNRTYDDDDAVFVQRFASPGAVLSTHANNGNLERIISQRRWTAVLLQEQSQTAGMWNSSGFSYLFDASRAAVVSLDEWIVTSSVPPGNADTILLMTWGRRIRDNRNPGLFPDFTTMQDKLAEGYYRYRDAITLPGGRSAKIAPVGLAFQVIHDAILEQGDDPTENGSAFSALYSDGSHPSPRGTYLAACVVYATLTGNDPRLLSWAPSSVSEDQRDELQSVAFQTVAGFAQYPSVTHTQPTISLMPSHEPSLLPSQGPFNDPSTLPSLLPSQGPVNERSTTPSFIPSPDPFNGTSDTPSFIPSQEPFHESSDTPSRIPSNE